VNRIPSVFLEQNSLRTSLEELANATDPISFRISNQTIMMKDAPASDISLCGTVLDNFKIFLHGH